MSFDRLYIDSEEKRQESWHLAQFCLFERMEKRKKQGEKGKKRADVSSLFLMMGKGDGIENKKRYRKWGKEREGGGVVGKYSLGTSSTFWFPLASYLRAISRTSSYPAVKATMPKRDQMSDMVPVTRHDLNTMQRFFVSHVKSIYT
jgi:hypothetical protein